MTAKQWTNKRLKTHKKTRQPIETRIHDGRWIKIQDRQTKSGYTVSTFDDISELKEREASLLESSQMAETAQRRLIAAIESFFESFVLLHAEDRFVVCNKRYRKQIGEVAKMLRPGIPRVELIKAVAGNRFKKHSNKERDAWVKLRLKHHKDPGAVMVAQFPNAHWAHYQDFKTNDGGRVSLFTDITEVKEHELALRESELRFQQAIEGLPDGLVIFDQKDRFVLCNSRYKALTKGAAPYLVPGVPFKKIIPASANSEMAKHSRKEREAWIRLRISRHKNPTSIPETHFEDGRWTRYSDFRTQEGMLVSLLTDITELKDREQALLNSEVRLKAAHTQLVDAIESMSEDFAMFDANDRLVTYNSKFLEHYKSVPGIRSSKITLVDIIRFFANVTTM